MIVAVTITFNAHAAGILDPFMASWRSQREVDAELLIIDNASSDGTADYLRNLPDTDVVVQLNQDNIGFAAGCNQAIEFARKRGATHLLLLNNDTEFGPTLLRDLAAAAQASDADAISPVITFFDRPDLIWYAGGGFSVPLGMMVAHYRQRRPISEAPVAIGPTSFAPGCCLLIRMATFDAIGTFDERYFVYWEDADFCLRMTRRGLMIMVDPGTRLAHKESVTTGGSHSDFSLRMIHRNHMYFLHKNYGLWLALLVLPGQCAKALVNLAIGRKTRRQIGLQWRAIRDGLAMPVA